MPEILTKYPEIVLQIFREAGIRCGSGAPQRILTSCPPERFCSFPTGEICVYGLNEVPKMTQISAVEISQIAYEQFFVFFVFILVLLAFILGILIGFAITKFRK